MYQIGWFSTGRGKGSRGLLQAAYDSINSGELKARLSFVFCSRVFGETEATDVFLRQVENYRIPLVTFSYQKFKSRAKLLEAGSGATAFPGWRLEYDREVMKRLERFRVDLCILAGYMLIIGPEMCQKYDMINLHPAAPDGPTGTWQEVIWKLIETDARQTGAMMHLVTPELDRGPVVTYCTFPIRGGPFDEHWKEVRRKPLEQLKKERGEDNPLFKLIRQHGMARELPLVISTVKAFSEDKISITPGKKVVDSAGRPINGYDLTEEVDRKVKQTH